MTKRAHKVAAFRLGFDSLGVGRLTWVGLSVATIGWALLLLGGLVPDLVVAKSARPLPPTFHSDLMTIAKEIIESGFALAIIGALHNGFGTLNRFFGAVLTRSGQRESPAPPPKAAASIEGRPYRMFADGSVEVDTIVGTRLFGSMAEAREFI